MYVTTRFRFCAAGLLLVLHSAPAFAETAEEVYAVAAGHYSNGLWQMAEEEFARFLEENSNHKQAATAMFLRAESQVQQGKYAEARKGFLGLLERDPYHRFANHAIFRAGETAYLAGDYEQASLELTWFRDRYPKDKLNAYASSYLGEIALASKDAKEARSCYEEALRHSPDGFLADQCRFGLGRALELQGELDAARRQYGILAETSASLGDDAQVQIGISHYNRKHYERAEAAFQTALQKFPDTTLLVQIRYWLGMSQIARRKWTEAAATFQEAVESHPEHALTAAMMFWLAEARRHTGDPALAKTHYERVVTDWPDSDWADDSLQVQIQLALSAADHDELDALVRTFDERYAESPLRPAVKQAEGRSLLKRKEYAKVVQVFEDLVQLSDETESECEQEGPAPVVEPETIQAERANWYYLALAYLGNEQHEQALQTLARVRPQDNEAKLTNGVWVAQAMACIGLERYADAIPPLRRYLASQPDGPESTKCRVQLVVALTRSGQLREALEAHANLTEQDAEHSSHLQATHYLSEAAYAAGEYEAAKQLYAILIAKDHSAEYADQGWSGLGWCNYKLDKIEAASQAFGRLVEEYPESPLAAESAMMQAKCLEKLGRLDKAVEAYLVIITTYQGFEHAASALFEVARLQEQLERKGEAGAMLTRLVEDYPTFPQLDAALYQLAWLLVDLDRAREADRTFQRLSDNHRNSRYWADATYRLAEQAASAEQHAQAGQLVQSLIDADDCHAKILSHALYLKGQLAASTGRWADVDEPMQRLLDEFPDSELCLPARYWMAEALFRRREYEAANDRFSQLAGETQDREDAWLATIPLRQSQILAQKEQWKPAYDLALSIKSRFPNFRQQYEADYVIGRCLALQTRLDQARDRFERVIRSPEGGKTETAAMSQWMIGECYMHEREFDEAIKAYHRVESLFDYPRWQAAALLQAGICHQLKGEAAEATKLFDRLIEQHPETTFAEEAAERLQQLAFRTDDTSRLQ